jgi:uracil-DNA glycosylase family protein
MNQQTISAKDFLPSDMTLATLHEAARSCKGCDLYENATQTVFGEGLTQASIVFIGEQPGDVEDRQGKPFVGPAGRLLDRALAEASIARSDVYVTNAVKHFKWIQRGKRRLHQKPLIRQVVACRPWLQAELQVIRPKLVVCLGATAARSMLGADVHIAKERGKLLYSPSGERVCVTIHPSSIYRQREREDQEAAYQGFVADIKTARGHLV